MVKQEKKCEYCGSTEDLLEYLKLYVCKPCDELDNMETSNEDLMSDAGELLSLIGYNHISVEKYVKIRDAILLENSQQHKKDKIKREKEIQKSIKRLEKEYTNILIKF